MAAICSSFAHHALAPQCCAEHAVAQHQRHTCASTLPCMTDSVCCVLLQSSSTAWMISLCLSRCPRYACVPKGCVQALFSVMTRCDPVVPAAACLAQNQASDVTSWKQVILGLDFHISQRPVQRQEQKISGVRRAVIQPHQLMRRAAGPDTIQTLSLQLLRSWSRLPGFRRGSSTRGWRRRTSSCM